MILREVYEDKEEQLLNQFATRSKSSKGRKQEEEKCDIRTEFQRDRDRILHCKAFRRLKHKTQVFIAPEGDHYRTRLTHTLEVAQIARTISRALGLNEDLTEAIALGHDLGHTPFGHSGEQALNEITKMGFRHNEQSVRVVEQIEKKGAGLNLTYEVIDGILNHPTSNQPHTLEGQVVRISDKIAYINHDIDDAVRGKVLDLGRLPEEPVKVLGDTSRERINNMIHNLIIHSLDQNKITMSDAYSMALKEIRQYMFKNVYIGSKAKEQEKKAKDLIKSLFFYYHENWEAMPDEYTSLIIKHQEPIERVVCDYIAGMTDTFAINAYCRLKLPRPWDIY
ncbi:deoxyguanosinetriphosphate triphosphohydrolase [Vallitalea okinawensis]|uniref:deoxyguanosinetriphosphate triphosphohydrolase n=1 Tax=Vallitalea okinawensis TaxID=2078660 RepID=UPI000CFB835E|nr:deoxyguanosinetriphosphate triphosphohydrolase [Vallitalea okinawensis]